MLLARILVWVLTLGVLVWFQACCGMTEKKILLDCCDAWNCLQNEKFAPQWTATTDPCLDRWYGIVCSNQSVTQIHLNASDLTGSIPSSLGNLSKLVTLNLYGNSLAGSIPSSLGNLSKLELLDLNINSLTGSIPSSLGNLGKLELLALSGNSLTGSIPSSLGNVDELWYLDISYNLVTSSIPASFVNLTSLGIIDMSNNALEGTVPNIFRYAESLTVVILSSNNLGGSFPFESLPPTVTQLAIANNALTGNINAIVVDLPNLGTIDISFNNFRGNFPTQLLLKAPSLTTFVGGFNCFEGSLDEAICNSTRLQNFIAPGLTSGKECITPIWKGIPSFPAFIVNNYLEGTVPQCLFGMPNIENIIISGNGLLGKLPEDIAPSLKELDASNNRLKGVLPGGNLFNGSLSKIDVSVNYLEGNMDAFQALNAKQNVSTMVVKTNLNRLSGALPASLLKLGEGNISVLQGNVFTCGVNIPSKDLSEYQYSCGSTKFNNSMYLFVTIVGASILVILCWVRMEPDFWISYGKKIRLWYDWASHPASIPKVKEWIQSINNLAAATLPGNTKSIYLSESFRKFQEKVLKQMNVNIVLGNIKRYMAGLTVLQKISIWLGITITSIISLHLILWAYAPGLYKPYAWVTTSVYLSGKYAVGVLSPALLLLLCEFYYFALTSYYYHPQVLNEESKEGDEPKKEEEEEEEVDRIVQLKSYLRLFLILLVNTFIVGAINFKYTEIIDKDNVAMQQLASFTVAIFKVFWSIYGYKYLLRSKLLYFGMEEEEAKIAVVTIFGSVPSFLAFLNVVNNLLLPIAAFSLFGEKCFRYAFIPQPEGSYEYTLSTCASVNQAGTCTTYTEVSYQKSYEKPFVYQYQCTSAIIQAYSNVYMFKFCGEIASIIIQQVYIVIVLMNEMRKEDVSSSAAADETVVENGSTNTDEKTAKTAWETLLLWLMGKNLALFYRDGTILKDVENAKLCGCWGSSSSHNSGNKRMKLFDPLFFSARTVGLLSIMLTFGPFLPIVGFAAGSTIGIRIAGMRVIVGRLLEELSSIECSPESGSLSMESMRNDTSTKNSSRERQRKKVLSKEEKQLQLQGKLLHSINLAVQDVPLSLLWENHRFMIYLSALWYACVITDMYAIDKAGEFIGYVPGLVILCFPLLLECVGYIFINWYLPTQSAARKSNNDDDRSTVQAAADTRDTSTSSVSMVIDMENPMHSADNDVILPSSDNDGDSTKEDDIHEL